MVMKKACDFIFQGSSEARDFLITIAENVGFMESFISG